MTTNPAPRAERIKIGPATLITGLARRALQHLAQKGRIPGAAKLGSRWTFDEVMLRRWIKTREIAPCPTISTGAEIFGGPGASTEAATYEKAYEQAIRRRRAAGATAGLRP